MMLILFQRVMQLEDKIILYVVPKIINSNNHNNSANIRSHFKKEQNSLASNVFMLKPILIGDYELSRYKIYKICKDDSVLNSFLNSEIFLHWSNTFDKLDLDEINNFSKDIKKRLQFIFKKYEIKKISYFEDIVNENFIEYKSFYKIKSVKNVKFKFT